MNCEFEGDNLSIISSNGGTLKLRLARFCSDQHPKAYLNMMSNSLLWDVTTKTLFYRDRNGTFWTANWNQVEKVD